MNKDIENIMNVYSSNNNIKGPEFLSLLNILSIFSNQIVWDKNLDNNIRIIFEKILKSVEPIELIKIKEKISTNVNISYLNQADYVISTLLPNITQKYKNIKTNLLPIFFEDVQWEKVLDKDQINKLIERIIINSDYVFLGNVLSKINVKNLNINSDINPLWKYIKDEKILETLINNGVVVDLKKLYIELKSKINNMYSEYSLINWLENNMKESEKNSVKDIIDNNFSRNKLNELYDYLTFNVDSSEAMIEIKKFSNWKNIVFDGNKNIFMIIAKYQCKLLNNLKGKQYFKNKLNEKDINDLSVLDYYLRSLEYANYCSSSTFLWLLDNCQIKYNKEAFLDIKPELTYLSNKLVEKHGINILIGESFEKFSYTTMSMLENNTYGRLQELAKNISYLDIDKIKDLPKSIIGLFLIFNEVFRLDENNAKYKNALLMLRPELMENYSYSEGVKNIIGEENYMLMEQNTLKNLAHKNTSLVTKKRL